MQLLDKINDKYGKGTIRLRFRHGRRLPGMCPEI
ncbi:MAG: DUF4113 domain-containing protein [Treponema sp.]|nr:DUF4113 domain-containing protein [Treponema sp.]